ncbi:MAG: phosphotransferase [Armatimonadetes bacterium]|nr:phosphotransferase [Armatimonadota bacterium]
MSAILPDDLRAVLQAYGLTPERWGPAGGTAGRTWRVDTAAGSWFVRRRGPRTSTDERVEFDQGLRRHLRVRGFPAYPAVDGPDGRPWLRVGDGVFEVYAWVAGRGLEPELAERARVPAAVTLALFHRLAADYDVPCEPLVPQFGHYPEPIQPRDRFDQPGAFLEAALQLVRAHATPANRPAFKRACERLVWFQDAYYELQKGLPRDVIHGDYNGCNLLFRDDGEVTGVFDWDWAWRDTRVRDVGEGILFFGARRDAAPDGGSIWSLTQCPRFDTEPMRMFLAAYHRAAPLSADELRAVPLAMLGRWIACRTEGAMKVPTERRAEFLLAGFETPFEWYNREAERLLIGL